MLIKKIINRIVRSSGSPDKNDLWLDDNLNLKVHENEEWKTIAGEGGGGEGSDSSGEGGGCSCLPPMIVEGTFDLIDGHAVFTPNVGMPSLAEARAHMLDGGQVYMIAVVDEEPYVNVAVASGAGSIAGYDFVWANSDSEGGDDDEPQTYTIQGTVNSDKEFTANAGQMLYGDAKNHYRNGDTIILQFTSLATGMTLNQTVVSWTDEAGATTTNGFTWVELL